MKSKRPKDKKVTEKGSAVRASVSFPSEVYKTLEVIAKEKKVSMAWVVRDAAEKYIEGKWPLFAEKGHSS